MHRQQTLELRTPGRGTHDVTAEVVRAVAAAGVETGIANVFLEHTSAGLILCENADPQVLRDLETWMARAVPDGDPA
ncbi:MAG TPA: YjbQ family protein, partial [Planctomycetota bacterium]